jgi:hypothetical protein
MCLKIHIIGHFSLSRSCQDRFEIVESFSEKPSQLPILAVSPKLNSTLCAKIAGTVVHALKNINQAHSLKGSLTVKIAGNSLEAEVSVLRTATAGEIRSEVETLPQALREVRE